MRPLALAVLAAAGLALTACSDGLPTGQDDPGVTGPSLKKKPNIVVDGVLSAGEWTGAAFTSFGATTPDGPANVGIQVTHDNRYLYLSALVSRSAGAFHPNDGFAWEFDNDNDGVSEDGDDIVLANATPVVEYTAGDYYRFTPPGGPPAGANQADIFPESEGGTFDVQIGFAKTAVGLGEVGVWEWRHDLNSSDNLHDFSITPTPTQTVGFFVLVSIYDALTGSYLHTRYPASGYCALTIGTGSSTTLGC